MTYRERRERRLEQREAWAESRAAKRDQEWDTAREMAHAVPLGQPVLVGHHSEKWMRGYYNKIDQHGFKGLEHAKMAGKHEAAASTLAHELDRSIYDDDPDAIERITERIADLEAKRAEMVARNAEYRKAHRAELKAMTPYQRSINVPHPPYELQNLGGNITRYRKRIESIKRRQALTAEAEENGGVTIIEGETMAQIVFADIPPRETREALKAAGFWYSKGRWTGYRSNLTDELREMVNAS